MNQELKTLKSRFYVAKSQRLSDGLPWPYDTFDAWLEQYMKQVPEGTDPTKCRTKYLEDGTFEVLLTRGGKGRRTSAKPQATAKKRDVVRDAIEVSTYVATLLEEPIAIDLSDLDEAVEELLK